MKMPFCNYISLWVSLLGTIGTFMIACSALTNLDASTAAKISETRFDYNSDQVENLSSLKADTVIGFSVIGLATVLNFANTLTNGFVIYQVKEIELLASICLVIALVLILLLIRKVYIKKFSRKILIEMAKRQIPSSLEFLEDNYKRFSKTATHLLEIKNNWRYSFETTLENLVEKIKDMYGHQLDTANRITSLYNFLEKEGFEPQSYITLEQINEVYNFQKDQTPAI